MHDTTLRAVRTLALQSALDARRVEHLMRADGHKACAELARSLKRSALHTSALLDGRKGKQYA